MYCAFLILDVTRILCIYRVSPVYAHAELFRNVSTGGPVIAVNARLNKFPFVLVYV